MEPSEFPELFQQQYKRLLLIAAASSGRSLAEDVVQEAAVVAYRKFAQFKPGSNFGAWMATIVRNCAANERRKSNRAVLSEPQWFDLQEATTKQKQSGEEISIERFRRGGFADELELDDNVMKGLMLLSTEARCCLLLRVVEDMSYEEISSYLEIPKGTAMSHVHRSKKQLRQQLQPASESDRKGGGHV